MSEAIIDYEALRPIRINPGAEVEGADFFGREKELVYMKRTLKEGSGSILIPGPRRWGKSSFIKEFARRTTDDLNFFYMHLQACQTIESFYDYFLSIAKLDDPFTFFLKSGRVVRRSTKRLAGLIKSAGFKGFKIESGTIPEEANSVYLNSMGKLIRHFPEKKILLVLDEISDFLLDVRKNGGDETVQTFLKWLRTLRQQSKVQMIITGSINIAWTLKDLQSEDLVGDVTTYPLKPLDEGESILFFRSLLKSRDIRLEGDALTFCAGKIKDGIHYFIQVFADRICMECDPGTVINEESRVKSIYDSFLQSDIPQFSNFHTRLIEYFPEINQKASMKILAHTSHSAKDFEDLFALTGQYYSNERPPLHSLLQRLCDEGYLVERDKRFSFISTLLADYWRKHYYFEE